MTEAAFMPGTSLLRMKQGKKPLEVVDEAQSSVFDIEKTIKKERSFRIRIKKLIGEN